MADETIARQIRLKKFRDLHLADPFFDSLKRAYAEFPQWFARKADEDVYVVEDGHRLSGMVYLKLEVGPIEDVHPPLPSARWLKVGTLKIEARGTKLGERVLKKILDTAIAENMDGIYITAFDLHGELLRLFERYGFRRSATKTSANGTEIVLVRDLRVFSGDLVADYPFFRTKNRKAWLLAVYPQYHTQLLPDSILNNEPRAILRDVSHTNTIHKIYVGRIPLTQISSGDVIVIYRTSDGQGPAYYRSVATSICIAEEVLSKQDFPDDDAFIQYAAPHSVFSTKELRRQFGASSTLYVMKMTYNAAFGHRMTRGRLLDEVGITEQPRWDLRELSYHHLSKILSLGKVNARLIVD